MFVFRHYLAHLFYPQLNDGNEIRNLLHLYIAVAKISSSILWVVNVLPRTVNCILELGLRLEINSETDIMDGSLKVNTLKVQLSWFSWIGQTTKFGSQWKFHWCVFWKHQNHNYKNPRTCVSSLIHENWYPRIKVLSHLYIHSHET